MQRFVSGETPAAPVHAYYPFVRMHTATVSRADTQLAYGFVEGPGTHEATLTRPDLFSRYYAEQFRLLIKSHGVPLEVGLSDKPIPIHFSFAENDHIEGTLSRERRQLMRDVFDLPDLEAMDDGIANGTWRPQPGEALPLSLFTAPRVDYSLHRLRHYTGTQPEWFQNFVLFTNYQFYIDEFIRLGHAEMAREDSASTWPSSSPATWSRAAPACRPSPMTSWARRRRACRRCRPTTWCAPTTAASPWSTSAWGRPMPRPSPTTLPCCARTPG